MGCCGKKRQAWLDSTKSTSKEYSLAKELPGPIADRIPQVFENMEAHSLVLKGAVTGKTYYFKEKGHRIHVDYMDAFAMKAESCIKIVTS